ncbi:GTPase, partial [Nocardioides ultimimeridianus]
MIGTAAAPPAPRGLGASVRRPGGDLPGRGSDLGVRLTALEQAVAAARGRLDDVLLDEALASVERAGARLRLSATHTVVAIAGATGSGKSATFNALAGTEISSSTAQRPTTSRAKALVWGEAGAEVEELLDWLGVDPADRTTRADLGDRVRRDRLPEGLILLDLPDHDSIETAHHEEAHRVVALADALVWVVDPQKYADAAIHREFLRPLAGHRDVTMVVLNHLDTVPEDRRQWMLRDVRRVVAQDGMRDARVLGVSARHGMGVDDLRAALRRRVEEKRHSVLRVDADLRAASQRLLAAAGDAPTELPTAWVADLERRVADAAGVDTVLARLERADAERRRRGLWRPAGG